MELESFKEICRNDEPAEVVQKCLIEGNSYYFRNNAQHDEYRFKRELADYLGVHIRDVVIVGSGKLGFSLKPVEESASSYMFPRFDAPDKDKRSDIDVAIVSGDLFDRELVRLYQYTESYKSPHAERNSMAKYALKGRLVPKYFPTEFDTEYNEYKMQSLIDSYEKVFNREVNFEIYKSWYYFEAYHERNFESIKMYLYSEG